MDTPGQLKTSFIPKKALIKESDSRRRSFNFLTFVALVIFLASILGFGGTFIYKKSLEKEIESLKKSLEIAKEQFEPRTLQRFVELDKKLKSGREILSKHTAMIPFFDHLEEITVRTVRFKDFSFSVEPGDKIKVRMNGQAPNYKTVALQADEFNKSNFILNPIFSGLDLDSASNVIFLVEFVIDPSVISYSRNLSLTN